jgi:hypothetical protein
MDLTSPTSTTVQSPGTTALNNLTGLTSSMKLEDEPAEPPPDVYTKQDEDPFAASESADPFNKTDAPSGDPFGTSADDPFVEKAADPFAKADDAFGGDPFGAGADPFGSSSDPFGGAPSADPFGSGGGSDPFGDSSADPFGDGKSDPFDEKSNDPFGAKSTGRNRDSDSEVYLV